MKTRNKVLIFLGAYFSVCVLFCLYCRKFISCCNCCCGSAKNEDIV